MSGKLRIGDVAPKRYTMRVSFTEVDITTSTSATIELIGRNGRVIALSDVEIINRTTTTVELVTTYSITLLYMRVAGDLTESGPHVAVGVMEGPFGELRSSPRDRYVYGKYQTSR